MRPGATTSRRARPRWAPSCACPKAATLDPSDIDVEPPDDETMIINLGPPHPSTHGVLRVMVELDGETVLRSKPVIGYLHTGMEKTGEELTYHQGAHQRHPHGLPVAASSTSCVFSLAVEKLLGIEIPPRATWIRMLMCELNRISLAPPVAGHQRHRPRVAPPCWSTACASARWSWPSSRRSTGLRMNHNYIRPGGVAADLPDGWRDDVEVICETIPARMDEYDNLLTGQPIFRKRMEGVGPLSADRPSACGLTGPLLRSTGVAWDLRRTMPYLAYDDVDFDVIVGTYGDCWDRYAIRFNEIRESVRIVRQIVETMPRGDYRTQDKKVTPPPRNRIDESMEALIHHFKLFTEGFRVPPGEVYVPVESPRGELGCYIVSDGTASPYRMHMRAPASSTSRPWRPWLRGALIADTIAIISTIDPVLGDVDR